MSYEIGTRIMRYEIGTRVGAIQKADKTTVHLIGYGTYQGEKVHPTLNFLNPCIELDNGGQTWGCECWWGPEEEIREIIGEREVILVGPQEKNDEEG